MKTYLSLLLTMLLVAVGMQSRAQSAASTDYILGPDDVIEISVPSHSDFNHDKELNKTLPILPDGKINYSGTGAIQAAGKTPSALAADIKKALEKTRDNVVVVVVVREIHSRHARVLGAIKAAGSYDLKPNWRLDDLIAMAGGLTEKPTHINGQIVRGADKVILLDVARAVDLPNSDANVSLQPEDLVLLSPLDIHNQVNVMGHVTRPGAYDLEDHLTVMGLLSQAGGATDSASLSRAYVMRGSTQIPLNLVHGIIKGDLDATVMDFKFQAGDVLMIPENTARFAVVGEVTRPGSYIIPETEAPTVLKALGEAGGQLADSDVRKAAIIRTVGGKATVTPIDIDALLKKNQKDPSVTNVTLQADDVLYIPSRRRDRNIRWNDVLSPMSMLYYMGVLR